MWTQLDLFSGIGGFTRAAGWAGFTTVGMCEIEPFCQAVLRKHWPDTWIHDDITTLTIELIRERCGHIHLLCAGFPCQNLSDAGQGAGLGTTENPTDRSGLWYEALRIIVGIRPTWVLLENVPGIRSKPGERPGESAIDTVLRGLEEAGYAAEPFVVGADDVGAPHRRKRVWIVGHLQSARGGGLPDREGNKGMSGGRAGTHTDRAGQTLAVAPIEGLAKRPRQSFDTGEEFPPLKRDGDELAHTTLWGGDEPGSTPDGAVGSDWRPGSPGGCRQSRAMAHASKERLRGRQDNEGSEPSDGPILADADVNNSTAPKPDGKRGGKESDGREDNPLQRCQSEPLRHGGVVADTQSSNCGTGLCQDPKEQHRAESDDLRSLVPCDAGGDGQSAVSSMRRVRRRQSPGKPGRFEPDRAPVAHADNAQPVSGGGTVFPGRRALDASVLPFWPPHRTDFAGWATVAVVDATLLPCVEREVRGVADELSADVVRAIRERTGWSDAQTQAWWQKNHIRLGRYGRTQALKAYGNAIVPSIAFLFLSWIREQLEAS